MTVAHAVFILEPRHQFHVFLVVDAGEQVQPVIDGLAVLFSMEGKYDAGPFTLLSSLMLQAPLGHDGGSATLLVGRS